MENKLQIFNYNGANVTMRKENGEVYVNLTEVAKAFPEKNLTQIVNSQEISEYVRELSELQNYSSAENQLLTTVRGGSNRGETWAHQRVALRVAQKLSTKFAIWCDTKVEELLTKGYTKVDSISKKDLAKMLLESEEEKERMQEQLAEQKIVIEYKENVITGLVDNVSLAEKRQILNRVVRHKGADYLKRWRLLYKEFEDKYHINLEIRLNNYNRDNNTKLSKLDYVDKIIGKLTELYDLAAKLFESDINELVAEMYKCAS